MSKFQEIGGGITSPLGFKATGVSCGIKEKGKRDLALIYSETPAIAVGMFTTNKFKAAPVILDLRYLKRRNRFHAVVVNSGNANAATGEKGLRDAEKMASVTAENLGIEREEVLVASTGVIGVELPIEKIEKGIVEAVETLSYRGSSLAAEAIITTDTYPKEVSLETKIKGRGKKTIKIGGIAKGSGMVCPNLATMLAFLTTDACISEEAMKESLRLAVSESFNRITVDGCMSTNDTVILMANGLGRNQRIKLESEHFGIFLEALTLLCQSLARMIVGDGEGASKLIEVRVKGAWNSKDAHRAAKAIANSSLVKTAIYGGDPNWGRIISALGSVKVKFKPEKVSLKLQDMPLIEKGEYLRYEEKELSESLKKADQVSIEIDLHQGAKETTVWTCDLTEEYIKINAHYRT
ncbi:MAG TPA: bifunctional glutamate N-acetyltransferase/amino-acid acetyltransferase ArgJ [Candidatus Omnitrophica bacterium]|nr:bifunctional glutamate N-acetyltransferase/amino-acid acetyltransferase ArgJ [Candidatus Omnitrophota bacterium]